MSIYCPKCGTALPDESKFCFKCGAAVPGPGVSESPLPPPAFTTASPQILRLLCYVGGVVSGIIFLNLDPYRQDADIRFHAWQSIFFTLTWIGVVLLHGVLPFLFFPLFPIAFLIQIAFFILWVLLLVKAYNGEKFKLPILGDLAENRSTAATI